MPSQIRVANVVPADNRTTPEEGVRQMKNLDYEIRVTGRIPADVLEQIDDVHVAVQPLRTILRGSVPDQAKPGQQRQGQSVRPLPSGPAPPGP
jgi:hypothetical protein